MTLAIKLRLQPATTVVLLYQFIDKVEQIHFILQANSHHLLVNQFPASGPMSAPPPPASLANFQYIFDAAVKVYMRQTKKKNLEGPLAAQLGSCDSPAAIMALLQDHQQRLSAQQDPTINNVLNDAFGRVESFFERLETYVEVPPTAAMMNIIVKIMIEVLGILEISTTKMRQGRIRT